MAGAREGAEDVHGAHTRAAESVSVAEIEVRRRRRQRSAGKNFDLTSSPVDMNACAWMNDAMRRMRTNPRDDLKSSREFVASFFSRWRAIVRRGERMCERVLIFYREGL